MTHAVRALGLCLALFCVPSLVFAQAVALVHSQLHTYVASPNVTATQSGAWSNPATWGGLVPVDRAKVAIPAGITVTVDGVIATAYDWIRVDGTLRFQPDVSTQLIADTVVAMGRLELGTLTTPVTATARLIFRSTGAPIDQTKDPLELSRGLIAMTPVSIVGAAKTAILPLAQLPAAGAMSVVLAGDPTGWQLGDEVLIAPTLYGQDEVVTVTGISGRTVTVTPALKFARVTPEAGLEVHVGNLTRTITIQTDVPHVGNVPLQGHVMLMGGGHTVKLAAFRDTGRTKTSAATDPILRADGTRDPQLMPLCGVSAENIRGRYALHFHNPGPDTPLSVVEGVVVRAKRNTLLKIGIINHSGHVAVRRSIVHQIDGSGLFTEEGDERGEFRENLVVYSKGGGAIIPQPRFPCLQNNYPTIATTRRHDMGGAGMGLWLEGADVAVIGNVFAGHIGFGLSLDTTPLSHQVTNTFLVQFPARLMRDGDKWLIASGAYPENGLVDNHYPPLLVTDNQVYAVSDAKRGSGIGFQVLNHLQFPAGRPKGLFARNRVWNVGACFFAKYTSQIVVEDHTCVAGAHPVAGGIRYGIQVAQQSGRAWDFRRVRIDGFTAGEEMNAGPESTFQAVTINGKPYPPQ